MSRIVDEPYFTYSAYSALTSGIQVKCPKCHGPGMVTADDNNAISSVSAAATGWLRIGRSTATMCITNAGTAAGTIGWILKMRQNSTFLFSA